MIKVIYDIKSIKSHEVQKYSTICKSHFSLFLRVHIAPRDGSSYASTEAPHWRQSSNFEKVRKSHRTTVCLKSEIKTIKNFDIKFAHDRIRDFLKIMNGIIEKKGNKTKCWFSNLEYQNRTYVLRCDFRNLVSFPRKWFLFGKNMFKSPWVIQSSCTFTFCKQKTIACHFIAIYETSFPRITVEYKYGTYAWNVRRWLFFSPLHQKTNPLVLSVFFLDDPLFRWHQARERFFFRYQTVACDWWVSKQQNEKEWC